MADRRVQVNPIDFAELDRHTYLSSPSATAVSKALDVAARDPEVGVEALGNGLQSFLTLGECPLHQRLDDLAPFAGRHHLVEFEKHLGRDGIDIRVIHVLLGQSDSEVLML